MLLFDLIDENVPATCLSKFVVDDSTGDGGKEEHVEKDENGKEDVVWLVVLSG